MKVIGLVGGMSWESSLEYYRIINEEVKRRLGGLHSARILMYSVDFHEIEEQQSRNRWEEAAGILEDAAERLARGGADFLLICTNTMHKVAPEVQRSVEIPLLHIADATAEAAQEIGISVAGLLGTKFTMEQDFLKGRLSQKHGLTVIVPDEASRKIVHDVIYNELCLGTISDKSKYAVLQVIDELSAAGAEGVILGCTELPLLIKQEDTSMPVLDTTALHAMKAVDLALRSQVKP